MRMTRQYWAVGSGSCATHSSKASSMRQLNINYNLSNVHIIIQAHIVTQAHIIIQAIIIILTTHANRRHRFPNQPRTSQYPTSHLVAQKEQSNLQTFQKELLMELKAVRDSLVSEAANSIGC